MKILLEIKMKRQNFSWNCLKTSSLQSKTVDSLYKADVLEGVQSAVEEVRLIKEGKLKGTPAQDLLDEL